MKARTFVYMGINQIKIRKELRAILKTSHLYPFCTFNRSLCLFITPLFTLLLLPPSKFHPLEQPAAALLPHRNLQFKLKNTHTHTNAKTQVLLLLW